MKMSTKQIASHITTGAVGERIAAKYLKDKGYELLEMNYRKKWGEIDLITKLNSTIHFIEVKTVSYETIYDLNSNVSRGTYRPEDNVHKEKLQRLRRATGTWIQERGWAGEYQLDVVTVRVVSREKFAVCDLIDHIIIE